MNTDQTLLAHNMYFNNYYIIIDNTSVDEINSPENDLQVSIFCLKIVILALIVPLHNLQPLEN